jgi:hypothetical protein
MPAASPSARRAWRLVQVALVLAPLAYLVCLARRWIEFGVLAGGWFYPYVRPGPPRLGAFLVLAPALAVAAWMAERLLRRSAAAALGLCLAVAFPAHLYIHAAGHYPLARLIASDGSNSFYSAARDHSPGDLLRDFVAVAPSLPLHARTNMPGKVLLYHLLLPITHSPEHLGWLLIALANLGAIPAFLVARRLLGDPRAALYAAILYLFIPAKLFFLPIPNTLSPLFILVALQLFLHWLDGRRAIYLYALGVVLYALLLFELTPFVMGVVFLAVLVRPWREGALGGRDLARIVGHPLAAMLATHVLMLAVTGFDVVDALAYVIRDSGRFNRETHRRYAIWVVHNLKEFFLTAGVAQSLLFLGMVGAATVAVARRGGRILADDPGYLLAVAVLVTLLATDLIGINRGEASRHWIFLAAFLQMVAADACVRSGSALTFQLVLAGTLAQSIATISLVAFVMP